jgi:hypothetical protein
LEYCREERNLEGRKVTDQRYQQESIYSSRHAHRPRLRHLAQRHAGTFRDQKAMAYEAARFAKTQNPADIIELVDRSSGTKLVMLADGRDVIVARRVLQIALSLVPAL